KAAGVTRRPQHRRRPCGRRRSAAGPWSEEPGFIPGDERGGAAPLRKTAPQTKAREPEGRGVTKRPQHRSERLAGAGAQPDCGGDRPEFTSGRSGGWDSPPKNSIPILLRLERTLDWDAEVL